MTFDQVSILFKHATERENLRFQFLGALLGVDLTDSSSRTAPKVKEPQQEGFFKDPKSYTHLSIEERKNITEKMKMQLKGMLDGVGPKPGAGKGSMLGKS